VETDLEVEVGNEEHASVRYRANAIVGALAITETISFGILLYGFGTFLPSMEKEFGWSKLSISGALSVGLLISGLAGLVIGRHLDRHSPRIVMMVGSLIASTGVFAWSHVHSLVALYLVWALLGLAMGATFYEPAFVVLSKWFAGREQKRALTIVTLVAGLASTIFVPWEEYLIRTRGWRPALRVLAFVLLVITVPLHALVLRKAPLHRQHIRVDSTGAGDAVLPSVHADVAFDSLDAEPENLTSAPRAAADSMSVDEASKDPRFWALLGACFLLGLTFAALISHQVSLLIERGWTAKRAAAATGAVGLWQLGARVVFSPLTRWFSTRFVTVAVWVSQVIALVALGIGTSPALVALFVATTGVSRGLYTLVRATSVADIFGSKNYGAISSRIALPATIAQAGGPIVGSLFYRAAGNYNVMLWVLAACAVVGTVLASRIHRLNVR
jgi:MFS family permease